MCVRTVGKDVAKHCPRHKTDAPLHCLGDALSLDDAG